MATTLVSPTPVDEGPSIHLWTLDEYRRIVDAGILGEGVRTELIEGRIYVRSLSGDMGQGNAHIIAVQLVFRALQAAFGEGFNLAMGLPLAMGEDSPEPDVRVLRGRVEDYDGHEADPQRDVALVVEVSDSTLTFDQKTKAHLYAIHGVPEYWIVNLRERTLEVRRLPDAAHGAYAETRILREGESVAVGGGTVAVSGVLPKA